MATVALGQMYPVLALGLVAAWWADNRGAHIASGVALGLTLAIKPTLAPVILWPIMRRRWETLGAAIVSGAAATLVGVAVLGPRATMEYVGVLDRATVSGYWDNASIPGATSRLFTENGFVEPVATLPGALPVAFTVGIVLVILTALRIAQGPVGNPGAAAGLWAMVAASLLASPVTWHNYLLLLAPGVILLLAHGRTSLAFLLLSLQFIPPSWPELWNEDATILSAGALSLYTLILLAHWLAFLTFEDEKAPGQETTPA
jgi:alpha-1,2-mannosyltransferase/arabinofuranan 3-O-arabinosyltransferase